MKKILPGLLLLSLSVVIAIKLFPGITMKEVTILTIPAGASVTINGVESGMSPMTVFVPAQGFHLEISRDGFFPEDSLFSHPPDTVFMQLVQGCLLVVNTIPTRCSVIHGDTSMVSPCSLFVKPGNPVEISVIGEMGVTVPRTVNVLSPNTRLVTVTVPWHYTESSTGMEFTVVPSDLLPFAMGPMAVGRDEVTAAEFCRFMNDVDPQLSQGETSLQGRTLLLDSIVRSNWRGPVGFNTDTTAYAPLAGLDDHPMTGVTVEGALWFCRWLSENSTDSLDYRLPRCDEWTVLAIAASADNQGGAIANMSDASEAILTRHPGLDDGWSRTAPSGALGRNAWGLGHMRGNVWEWTSDEGIAAGGSWLSSISDCSPEAFIQLDPELGYPFTGFRVVATGAPGNISTLIESDSGREL